MPCGYTHSWFLLKFIIHLLYGSTLESWDRYLREAKAQVHTINTQTQVGTCIVYNNFIQNKVGNKCPPSSSVGKLVYSCKEMLPSGMKEGAGTDATLRWISGHFAE